MKINTSSDSVISSFSSHFPTLLFSVCSWIDARPILGAAAKWFISPNDIRDAVYSPASHLSMFNEERGAAEGFTALCLELAEHLELPIGKLPVFCLVPCQQTSKQCRKSAAFFSVLLVSENMCKNVEFVCFVTSCNISPMCYWLASVPANCFDKLLMQFFFFLIFTAFYITVIFWGLSLSEHNMCNYAARKETSLVTPK